MAGAGRTLDQLIEGAAAEAWLDQEREPERARLARQWLADHPDRSAADFQRHAWLHLRANTLERHRADQVERTRQELAATGRYT